MSEDKLSTEEDSDDLKSNDSQAVVPVVWYKHEDWLAVIIGITVLLAAFVCGSVSVEFVDGETAMNHPWKSWVGKPGGWTDNPVASITNWRVMLGPLLVGLIGFGIARRLQGH